MLKIIDIFSYDRVERNYIKRMLLRDNRTRFRQKSQMTLRIKASRSSVFIGNMGCRYCEEDIRIGKQEHLKQCEGLSYEQRGLTLTKEMGKQIFWRRMAPKLDDEDKYLALKSKMKLNKEDQALTKTQKALIPTKVTKAKPNTKVLEKLKETRRAFASPRGSQITGRINKIKNCKNVLNMNC